MAWTRRAVADRRGEVKLRPWLDLAGLRLPDPDLDLLLDDVDRHALEGTEEERHVQVHQDLALGDLHRAVELDALGVEADVSAVLRRPLERRVVLRIAGAVLRER